MAATFPLSDSRLATCRDSARRSRDSVALLAASFLHHSLRLTNVLYLATLGIMLFRPPDVSLYALDRIAFLLLALMSGLRVCLTRVGIRKIFSAVSLPMMALASLAVAGALHVDYNPQTWSLVAAKFIVPYALYHVAQITFAQRDGTAGLEKFLFWVLAYLNFIAIAFLVGARGLIFPRFILDEGLAIHLDRARGPFLQAVANGVTLNLLGVLALNAYRRGVLRRRWAALLLIPLPLAILATMTRTVWISFAGSALVLLGFSSSRRVRRACMAVLMAGGLGLLLFLASGAKRAALQDRVEERGPVEIRLAVYKAGWQMFLERPISGWGVNQMPAELAHRMTDYHLQSFWVHNSYLEILVEHGLLGLALYLWIFAALFRVGRKCSRGASWFPYADDGFRLFWRVMLGVYLLNATFVVMNYQFVNGLLFTIAGIMAAQQRQLGRSQDRLVLN